MLSAQDMRTIAIGDIHGCHVALTTLLEQVAPRTDDRIIFLGDYIDRGPASREVVESLLGLSGKCAEAHWKFFEHTARYFETEDDIFVHACLDAEADMDEQPDWLLYWESLDRLRPHKSGKRIVCGHSPQRSGQILDLGFALCIDTGAVNGGWLTCLDVNSGGWWQSNEKRETRRGSIAAHS